MAPASIVRFANPGPGQGLTQAIHPVSGNKYEHDETDAQIEAVEELMSSVRAESGASTENRGRDEDGLLLRGATFSWNVDADGNVVISTSWNTAAGEWTGETWTIARDGSVS